MRSRKKARLHYPVPPAPRIAVLSEAFESRGSVRVFGRLDQVAAFQPQAIAGTLEQIEALGGAIRLTHTMIVFRDPSQPPLTDAERDRLWRLFEVPVFEQVVAADGTLLAFECEAHAGWHVWRVESAGFAWSDCVTDSTQCPCGRPTPRLVRPVRTQASASGA
jgi:hypothetical protein